MTTRTRAFRLEAVKSAPSAEGAKPRVYTFKASDAQLDRDYDRLNVHGWKLADFNANPVILVNHKALDLPVAKGRAYVDGPALMVDFEFDQNDPDALKIESKVAGGFLNAVSVRYSVPEGKFRLNEKGGFDSDEQELLEISIVTIPGNQRALRVKAHNTDPESGPSGAEEMTPEEIKKMQEELAAAKAKAAALEGEKLAADAKVKADADRAKMRAELEAEVKAEHAKAVIEQAKGTRDSGGEVSSARAPVTGEKASKGSGIEIGRFVRAQLHAKMFGGNALNVLKAWGHHDMAKALSQDSFAGMGSLVREEWSSDFIELLRNKSVVRAAGARTVAMGASLNFGGQATAASAAYIGETTNIATSNPTTSAPLILSEKKLAALVPIPNDLIRNASVGADQFVTNDLLQVMALTEDSKFIYGSGASYEPRGLKARLNTTTNQNIYAMTALTTAKIPTVGELKKEFSKAKRKLKQLNAPMGACAWLLNPVTEAGILNATGPGGEGYNMFEREMLERGTLAGFPFFVTNQIPDNGTSVDLFLFDFSEVIIGESMQLEVETFPNAAYYNGSSVVSGISSDQSVVRAITKHDIGLRHDVSGINVTGVTWGEP